MYLTLDDLRHQKNKGGKYKAEMTMNIINTLLLLIFINNKNNNYDRIRVNISFVVNNIH